MKEFQLEERQQRRLTAQREGDVGYLRKTEPPGLKWSRAVRGNSHYCGAS